MHEDIHAEVARGRQIVTERLQGANTELIEKRWELEAELSELKKLASNIGALGPRKPGIVGLLEYFGKWGVRTIFKRHLDQTKEAHWAAVGAIESALKRLDSK